MVRFNNTEFHHQSHKAKRQYKEVHVIVEGLSTVRVAMEENLCVLHCGPIRWDVITPIARLPRIYGNINHPCPWATPSDSGWFTAINHRQLGFNYYE